MNGMTKSPCLTCKRVADPENCDNKDCMLWRRWFIRFWDRLHQQYGSSRTDPCLRCQCPQELCFSPCSERLQWEVRQ